MQVKTASISNPEHYVNIARKLASDTPGAVFMDQFESEANYKVEHLLISNTTTLVTYKLVMHKHVCTPIRLLHRFECALSHLKYSMLQHLNDVLLHSLAWTTIHTTVHSL
jgi:hypothetical protein